MAVLRSKTSALCCFLIALAAHVTAARGKAKLIGDEAAFMSRDNNQISLRAKKTSPDPGPEPGDQVPGFTVPTLGEEFSFQPGALPGPLIVHAFTNRSGFLECLWSSNESLSSLVQGLPSSTHVLFLSLDESAVTDALWMGRQLLRAATDSRRPEVMKRLHVCPLPVFALGNWIPNVLHYWGTSSRLAQAVFTSKGWPLPAVVKRLDARYDWLSARWDQRSYQLLDAGHGCVPSASVAGAVAWLAEGHCSFYTKVQNMAKSNASGVLVYAGPGRPLQDMNCLEDECNETLSIPASMVHLEPAVAEALRSGELLYVSFQYTPSPSFFFAIDRQGILNEMGWFLYPSFSFLTWQAEWMDFYSELQSKLRDAAQVVPVFDRVLMQGEKGAVATVVLPAGLADFNTLELDASLSCPGRRDSSCAHWDHTVQLFICCDPHGPHCNTELGRWITAFRRGIGRWLTDVSPLLPLLDSSSCSLTMKTVPWAMPWMASLNLRFSISNQTGGGEPGLRPFRLMPLFSGGTFDRKYNQRYQPITFSVPAATKKVELYAVITAHGSDDNNCGEFCVTSHHFLFNSAANNSLVFDSAGTPLGCTTRVKDGGVPNEHGTWLYGRGGWCDGLQVDPWRTDVTRQLNFSESNTVIYFGLFEGRDPNPTRDPGYIIMSSFLVFYR